MRLTVIGRDLPFSAYRRGHYDQAAKRMVIEDIRGEYVVLGEPLAASLASRRWPADADTAAHLLDSSVYV